MLLLLCNTTNVSIGTREHWLSGYLSIFKVYLYACPKPGHDLNESGRMG